MYVPPRFTDAERAILKHLCAGCTSSEIATLRAVSTRTVANQMASMYRKMGVRSRQELIACLLAGTNR
jgi:DNA-binding CsgD family transcriptional regulator